MLYAPTPLAGDRLFRRPADMVIAL
ncbi:hypothetical protein A2U01_0058444, partial [Trifolium medium]|nr:hypothetical protein [Trifolium medium]